MKPIITILAIMAIGLPAFGQKKLGEAMITYDILINTGSERPRAADFLDGATSTVYLKGNRSRTEMVSSLGTEATIIDEDKMVYNIKEYGPQKYLIRMTPANWKDANRRYEDVRFTFSDDTKTIMGYKCLKAVGRLADGSSFVVWYTPDLVPENNSFQYVNRSLPGLAMEYESNVGTLKVTYTVSKLTIGRVPAERFEIPKSGYRLLTYEESKRQ